MLVFAYAPILIPTIASLAKLLQLSPRISLIKLFEITMLEFALEVKTSIPLPPYPNAPVYPILTKLFLSITELFL